MTDEWRELTHQVPLKHWPQDRTSSACKQFGHPEFQSRISDRAISGPDISWLLRYFEQRVADGERFRAGETLQIGWMLTMIEAAENGLVRIM